jgi:hypothetical protein
MMTIVYLLCATGAPDRCETHVADFSPAIPVACIVAAGPELARRVPEGWRVAEWHCTNAVPGAAFAAADPEDR